MDLEGKKPAPSTPIYSGGVGGQPHLFPGAALSLLQHLLLLRSAWRSPAKEPRAPSPPRRRAAGVSPQLSSPLAGSRRRRRPQAVRVLNAEAPSVRRLDRIFRDLNRREYDSINRVLVTLPLSDLQGSEDVLPISCC